MDYNDPEQCCFTMYEGNDLSVFKSTPYLKRLNNPTPWTKKWVWWSINDHSSLKR